MVVRLGMPLGREKYLTLNLSVKIDSFAAALLVVVRSLLPSVQKKKVKKVKKA